MKRAMLLALCLMLLCAAAQAEVFEVRYYGTDENEGFALLLTEDGVALTPPHTYESIYAITPSGTPAEERLYTAVPIAVPVEGEPAPGENDEEYVDYYYRVALMNARGELLTGFEYSNLEFVAPSYVIYRTPEWACGIMDAAGSALLPAEYADIAPTGDGAYLAVALDGKRVEYTEHYPMAVIGADGARHDAGLHVYPGALGEMACGLCPVAEVAEYDDKTVYVDAQGRVAFDRRFDFADSFKGGLARVEVDGIYGLIDPTGEWAAPVKYDYITHADEAGVYIATMPDAVDLLDDQTGAVIASLTFEGAEYVSAWSENPSMLNVSTGSENNIYTMDGTQVARYADGEQPSRFIEANYSRASGMPQRLVETRGSWPNTQVHLLDLELNQVGPDYQGMDAALWQDGVGRYVINRFFMSEDENGETVVDWRSYRSGVCDEMGEIVVEPIYRSISVLSPDRFWVTTSDGMGMIDSQGHWLYTISDYEALMD